MKFLFTLGAILAMTSFPLQSGENPVTVEVKVPAMKCSGCAWSVTSNLKKVENVTAVHVDYKTKTAIVEVVSRQSPGKAALYAAVEKSGYTGSGYRVLDGSFAAAKSALE